MEPTTPIPAPHPGSRRFAARSRYPDNVSVAVSLDFRPRLVLAAERVGISPPELMRRALDAHLSRVLEGECA